MNKMVYHEGDRISSFSKAHFKKELKVGFVVKSDTAVIELPEINFELEDMQKCVDGHIEVVHYVKDTGFDVIVNEEGLVRELPFNVMALIITGCVFYGNVLFLKKGILK